MVNQYETCKTKKQNCCAEIKNNDLGKSHDMDMDITWTECKMWLSIGQMCGMVKKNIDIDLKVLFEDNSDTSKYLFMAD